MKQLDDAFWRARSILAAEEWELCKILKNHLGTIRTPRHTIRHPRLGRSTAQQLLKRVAPTHELTIHDLLESNPQRMRGEKDTEETDRRLIIDDAEYQGPANERKKLASMEEVLEILKAEQVQDIGPPAKRQRTVSNHSFL